MFNNVLVVFGASFHDVPSNHWAKDFIEEVKSKNLMKGDQAGTFRPDDPISRAEIVQIAYNLNLGSANGSLLVSAEDLKKTDWFYPAVYWFLSWNSNKYMIVTDGKFYPKENATRAFSATVLYLAMNKKFDGTGNFPDLNGLAEIEKTAITKLSGKVINGYPDGTFKPNNPVTRAEVAKILALLVRPEENADPLAKFDQNLLKEEERILQKTIDILKGEGFNVHKVSIDVKNGVASRFIYASIGDKNIVLEYLFADFETEWSSYYYYNLYYNGELISISHYNLIKIRDYIK